MRLEPPRYCKDCTWLLEQAADTRSLSQMPRILLTCAHPQVRYITDPVLGERDRECQVERASEASIWYPCGIEGHLWEPKGPICSEGANAPQERRRA